MSRRSSRCAVAPVPSCIVGKRCTASAASRSAAVPSSPTVADVSTALLETSRLCYGGASTALLIPSRLGDPGTLVTARLRHTCTLVTSRLGNASACVPSECRDSELLDWGGGLGDLAARLALRILIR